MYNVNLSNMKIINVSINVDKIDKGMLIDGKKGRYLPLTITLYDEKDKYGNDVSVCLAQTEDERKAKKDRLFFGNGRLVFSSSGSEQAPETPEPIGDDDLPF